MTTRLLAKSLMALGFNVVVATNTPLGSGTELLEGYTIGRNLTLAALLKEAARSIAVISKGGVSALAGLAAMVARRPLVIWHEMAGNYLHDPCNPKVLLGNMLRKAAFNYAIAHVGVTEACLNSKPIPSKRLKAAIWNPVTPELAALASEVDQSRERDVDVLFVGRLFEGKGIFILVKALEKLARSGLVVRSCFVGAGPDQSHLKLVTERMPQVSIVETLQGARLAECFSRSRVLVLPSSTHLEGMGLVIAEAFAFGLPAIGSDQPAIREVIGDAGRVFRNGDADGLAEVLSDVLRTPALYAELGFRARSRAGLFDFRVFQMRVRELVDNLELRKPAAESRHA